MIHNTLIIIALSIGPVTVTEAGVCTGYKALVSGNTF